MSQTTNVSGQIEFAAASSVYADIDLAGQGKAVGFVRVPHSVHRSAYVSIPISIARIANGRGRVSC